MRISDWSSDVCSSDLTNNHRVRRVAPDGRIDTVAGNGVDGFSGDGGPATAASLYNPWGIALDGAGNLFIVDASNFRIRRVTPDGRIDTVAGTGVYGFSGERKSIRLTSRH